MGYKRRLPGGLKQAALLIAVLLVVAPAIGFFRPGSAGADNSGPQIVASSTDVAPGAHILLSGSGWPASQIISFAICGNGGSGGSTSCDGPNSVTAASDPTGTFITTMVVGRPPVSCPCVILGTGLDVQASLPITVQGMGVAALSKPDLLRLSVHASVTGGMSWGSFFGASAKRQLTLKVKNLAASGIAYPTVSARWGRSGHNDNGFPASVPVSLAPGKSSVIRMPFTLDPFSVGGYSVSGSVFGGVAPVTFRTSTSTQPWGLYLIVIAVLQVILLKVRNRVRDRLTRRREIPAPRPVPALDLPIAVVDLTDEPEPTPVATTATLEVTEPASAMIDLTHGEELVPAAGSPETATDTAESASLAESSALAALPDLETATEAHPTNGVASQAAATLASDVIDLRGSSLGPSGLKTSTWKLDLLVPERNLTCSVELLSCPDIGLLRTSVVAWDDFSESPWEAIHEGSSWTELPQGAAPTSTEEATQAADLRDSVGDVHVDYGGRGLVLDLHFHAGCSGLRMGEGWNVVPGKATGSLTIAGTTLDLDLPVFLECTTSTDTDAEETGSARPASAISCGITSATECFYAFTERGPDGTSKAVGWLVRDGQAHPVVEAVRTADMHGGPYPIQVSLELRDAIGRVHSATAQTVNGMAARRDDALVLSCLARWDADGAVMTGEDHFEMSVETWRSLVRSGSVRVFSPARGR